MSRAMHVVLLHDKGRSFEVSRAIFSSFLSDLSQLVEPLQAQPLFL